MHSFIYFSFVPKFPLGCTKPKCNEYCIDMNYVVYISFPFTADFPSAQYPNRVRTDQVLKKDFRLNVIICLQIEINLTIDQELLLLLISFETNHNI